MLEAIKEQLTPQLLSLLIPLFIIQLFLVVFCIRKIIKEGVANLNKWAWISIVIVGNITGSIIFLIVGRRRDI
jgi:hypothetical protein